MGGHQLRQSNIHHKQVGHLLNTGVSTKQPINLAASLLLIGMAMRSPTALPSLPLRRAAARCMFDASLCCALLSKPPPTPLPSNMLDLEPTMRHPRCLCSTRLR